MLHNQIDLELELEEALRDVAALTGLAIADHYLNGTLAKLEAAEVRANELQERLGQLRDFLAERPDSWGTW